MEVKGSNTIWESHDNQGAWGIIFGTDSASNLNVPKDIVSNVKRRVFRFLWKNKREKKNKIKRVGSV